MALPPRYQNVKDLAVMVEFIETYPLVAAQLKSIDLSQFTVYFGDDGEAKFGRKAIKRERGWVGPAAPLEFKTSNREIE